MLFVLDSSFSCFPCTLPAGCHFLCLQSGSIEVVCVWRSPLRSHCRVQPQGFGRPASFALSHGEPGEGLLYGLHKPFTTTVKMFEVYILYGWWVSLYWYVSVLGSTGRGIQAWCPYLCNLTPLSGYLFLFLWQETMVMGFADWISPPIIRGCWFSSISCIFVFFYTKW